MANTVFQHKRSGTPTNVPSSLELGELAINYADGLIFYKNTTGHIVSISGGGGGNSFGTINANGTLVVADTPGDVLSLVAGNNVTFSVDAVNDKITIDATGGGGDITPAFDTANAAFANGNANFIVLQTVSGVANNGWLQANAAFNTANGSSNAVNLTSGTISSGRLSGSYTGITGVGTLTSLGVTGTATVGNLTLSNPGIGNTSVINFAKTNDAASIRVTELTSDVTTYQFFMSDNPDSSDRFNWYIQSWEGRGKDWLPLEFTGFTTTIRSVNNTIDGNMYVGNSPYYISNGIKNTVHSVKSGTLNVTPDVSAYTGTTLQQIYIVLDSPTTFSAYNRESVSPTQYVSGATITGSAQTITANITVTFSGTTGGVTGDKYWFGVMPSGGISSTVGYKVANVGVIDSSRNATFANITGNQLISNTIVVGGINTVPTIQASFTQANTATTIGSGAFGVANTALSTAQVSFGVANAAFANANTTHALTINAFNQANSATTIGSGAFDKANTATTIGSGAFTQANAAFAVANSALPNTSGVTFAGNMTITGNVGIGTAQTSIYRLQVLGDFAANTKSFLIDHPTKDGMKLRYGSLEGPENGVYVRGKSCSNKIELPDYWVGLVHTDSITVQLTPYGHQQSLYVSSISNNNVYVEGNSNLSYYYTVFGERKDTSKLVVEF